MKCTRHYVAFLNRDRSSLFPRNHRRVLIHDMQMIMFTCCYLPPMLFSTVGWRLCQKAFRFTASPLDLPSTFSAQQCDTLVVANILTELSSGKHWERVSLPLFPLQENKLEITIRWNTRRCETMWDGCRNWLPGREMAWRVRWEGCVCINYQFAVPAVFISLSERIYSSAGTGILIASRKEKRIMDSTSNNVHRLIKFPSGLAWG